MSSFDDIPPPSPATNGSGLVPPKPWWKQWWAIAAAAVLVLVMIAAIVASANSDDSGSAASTVATPTTTTPESAPSTQPAVQTTQPAATEAPSTPAPTSAPTTEATTTTQATTTTTEATTAPAPPQQFSGTGDFVQPITLPGDLGIATITHTGTSNFAVTALDAGLTSQGLLVNVIGNYSGTVLVPANTSNLEITADGPWTVEVKPTASARPFDGSSVTGHGDDVVSYAGATGVAAITHVGQSNFVVSSYKQGSSSPDLLVNVIGNYTGSVPFPGPALVTVTADGDWTITVG